MYTYWFPCKVTVILVRF